MSLSLLLLFGFLSASWARPPRPSPPVAQPWIGDILIYQSSKKNLPALRAILTPCISLSSDKSLMSWHVHIIDESFKDHVCGLSLFRSWTKIASTYTWVLEGPPTFASFSLCQYVMKANLQRRARERRSIIELSAWLIWLQSHVIVGNTETVLGTLPWWCVPRHPRRLRFAIWLPKSFAFLRYVVWKSKPRQQIDMDVVERDRVVGNISWLVFAVIKQIWSPCKWNCLKLMLGRKVRWRCWLQVPEDVKSVTVR